MKFIFIYQRMNSFVCARIYVRSRVVRKPRRATFRAFVRFLFALRASSIFHFAFRFALRTSSSFPFSFRFPLRTSFRALRFALSFRVSFRAFFMGVACGGDYLTDRNSRLFHGKEQTNHASAVALAGNISSAQLGEFRDE